MCSKSCGQWIQMMCRYKLIIFFPQHLMHRSSWRKVATQNRSFNFQVFNFWGEM
jgi:hypothetical protein